MVLVKGSQLVKGGRPLVKWTERAFLIDKGRTTRVDSETEAIISGHAYGRKPYAAAADFSFRNGNSRRLVMFENWSSGAVANW